MNQKKAYQAILESRCPKCRQGHMFAFPINKITKFTKMNECCEVCGLRFEVEPGFFFGAMYVSYAITVAILITTGTILWFFDWNNIFIFLGIVVSLIIILLPFIFRYSRVLFLHWFGGITFKSDLTKGV